MEAVRKGFHGNGPASIKVNVEEANENKCSHIILLLLV